MNHRALRAAFAGLAIILSLGPASPAAARGPTIQHERFEERFADDFILDLCGIETVTTWTQQHTIKIFPDGSEQVHVVRTFVSDDPRLPIERGAATTFIAPDGTETVVGKPLQLIGPDGGVRILDAGWVEFGEELIVRGPHPSLGVDLAPYYCPPEG
jgi:hypothetical protein